MYVVDQAEVWCARCSTTVRPSGSTTGRPTSASTRAAAPDGSACRGRRGTCPTCRGTHRGSSARVARRGRCATITDRPRSVQQTAITPDGTLVCVRDDTGWLNLWLGDGRWSTSRSSTPGRRGGSASARSPCRPTATQSRSRATSAGSAACASSTSRPARCARSPRRARSAVVARRRLAALRTGARTPTQVVVYDTDARGSATVVDVGP